jgi:hypothetical protein
MAHRDNTKTIILQNIIYQLDYYLFTLKLNSPESNYKVSASKGVETNLKQIRKEGNMF